jgi:hypothetical protein
MSMELKVYPHKCRTKSKATLKSQESLKIKREITKYFTHNEEKP